MPSNVLINKDIYEFLDHDHINLLQIIYNEEGVEAPTRLHMDREARRRAELAEDLAMQIIIHITMIVVITILLLSLSLLSSLLSLSLSLSLLVYIYIYIYVIIIIIIIIYI